MQLEVQYVASLHSNTSSSILAKSSASEPQFHDLYYKVNDRMSEHASEGFYQKHPLKKKSCTNPGILVKY